MEKTRPTVSIVLPTYNRAGVLRRSIQSVLEQTYTEFELIIVDDGSTDNTKGIVKGLNESRINYIRHDINKGAQAARNTGIQASSGDYIAFQDSDDEWMPRKLEKQMKVFQGAGPEVGVVYTGCWRIHDGQKRYVPQPRVSPKEGDISQVLPRFNFISIQTAVVTRECIEDVGGFDEELPRLQDWELWIRVAEHYEFRYIAEPMVISYIQPDSISKDVEKMAKARERIVVKHKDRFVPEDRAYQRFRTGHSLLKAGHARRGRLYLWQAIMNDVRVLYCCLFLMSFFGTTFYNWAIEKYKSIIK